jgi:hypothetical protein
MTFFGLPLFNYVFEMVRLCGFLSFFACNFLISAVTFYNTIISFDAMDFLLVLDVFYYRLENDGLLH